MKTVISSKGNDINSLFDLRFGRAAWFCIYNEDTGEIIFQKNEYVDTQSGAGVKVAEKMIETGITKAISGDFGPKARSILDQFNVQLVIIQNDDLTIKEIIEKLK